MRFPEIPTAERSGEQRAFADGIVAGPRGRLRGPFLPLMHSPELATRIQQVGAHLRFGTDLPADLIEIAIVITARHFRCSHIQRSHREQALAAGVTAALVEALETGDLPRSVSRLISEPQRLAVRFCRELLENNKVSNTTFERAVSTWGHQGTIDLTAVCGYYGLLSMVLAVSSEASTEP